MGHFASRVAPKRAIVSNAQIACEIDIRTLTSHQIFDQVLGQILDQIFDQVLDQVFWTRKNSVQIYWYGKRLPANYLCIFRAYQKNRLPAIY